MPLLTAPFSRLLFGTAIVCVTSGARAQAWNVPLGGRTATMGASVAEGHDLAMPLVNPAGVAAVDTQVFGLTSSIYAYAREKVPRAFVPNGFHPSFGQASFDDPGLSSVGLSILPSGAALFRHFGRAKAAEPGHFVLGLAALSPIERDSSLTGRLDANLLDQNGALGRTTAVSESLFDLYVGPVAGLVLSRRLRVGLSLMGLYRRRYLQADTASTQTQSGGNAIADYRDSSFVDSRSFGAVAIAGLQFEPVDHFFLGLSAQAPSLQFTGSEKQQLSGTAFITAPGFGSFNVFESRDRQLDFTSREPLLLSGGVAYSAPKSFTLAADVRFRPATPNIESATGPSKTDRTVSGSATRTTNETYERTIDGKATIDFSIGGEVFLSDALALRGGYSQAADFRTLPTLGPETVYTTRRSYRTISAGLGIVVGPFDTTFGLSWQHTTGTLDAKDLYGVQPAADSSYPAFVRLDLSGDSLMFTLAATVSEKDAQKKILERVQGATGLQVGGAASIGVGVSWCPKSLDAAAIAEFDYSSLVEGDVTDGQSLKAGLIAIAELAAVTDRIDSDLQATCTAIVHGLEGNSAKFADGASACTAAEASLGLAKKKLGPDAHLELTLVPAVCTVSLAPIEACLQACGPAGATVAASASCEAGGSSGSCTVEGLAIVGTSTCALRCEARARAQAVCNSASVAVEITGATDQALAHTLSTTLTARAPALSRTLALAARKSSDLPKQALALADAVRASAQAIADRSPASAAAVAACVTGPASDFAKRIGRFGATVRAAASVMSTTSQK